VGVFFCDVIYINIYHISFLSIPSLLPIVANLKL
jgi:hypothetical protein